LKINFGAIVAIKERIPKKIIMSVVSLLLIVLAVVVFVTILKSCLQTKHSNMIDLDMLEPDGTINQKKIFDELIKDSEESMRYKRKNMF